nr:Pr6Pr family membrane protein [Sphingomonas sp. Y57]
MTAGRASRAAHALVAACAATGVALHYLVVLGHHGEVALRSVRFLSYFTILTNMLVAVSGLAIAAGRGRFAVLAARPAWRAAVTLDILVVALVYHLLLRNVTLPGAIGGTANALVHQLVPAAWTICWLLFPPHGAIDRAAPWRWLLYPLGFALWTLLHGAIGGWYPYPFMDAARLGYPTMLANILAIGVLFLGLGYGLRWVDGRLGIPRASGIVPAETGISERR